MSKKIIKLTESDLEKIVRRVIEENEHEEVVERIGDQLKAKIAGTVGSAKAKLHNRKELKRDFKANKNSSAIQTGISRKQDLNLQVPKKQKAIAQMASLSNSLMRDVKRATENMNEIFPEDTDFESLGQEGKVIESYKNALNTIITYGDKISQYLKKK